MRAFDNRMPDDDKVAGAVEALGAAAPGCVSVERVTRPAGLRYTPPAPEAVDLAAGRFERRLDRSWRRTSYTGIISAAHGPRVASEPEREGKTDEPDVTVTAFSGADEMRLREVASLWSGLAGGADVGTFVHRVLERIDFTVPDLTAVLTAEVGAGREPAAAGDDRRGGGGGRRCGRRWRRRWVP